MRTALVGVTGFVGGNLAGAHPFDALYHSKNIEQSFGTKPDLLLYAGLPAAKYLANTDPEGDWAVCQNAMENIRRIAPKQLVLISTVDVYAAPNGCTETTPADGQNPAAYGRNRAALEQSVRKEFAQALIVRLPGLFGTGLKKNFLYDMLRITPTMLNAQKYCELAQESELVAQSYALAANGFYALRSEVDTKALRSFFAHSPFNALSFTDSRSVYQFYDLRWLWKDIAIALAAKLTLLNVSTQPVSAAEIYAALHHGAVFENHLAAAPVHYDMRSQWDALYGGEDGYLYSKQEVLQAIRSFVFAARSAQED